MNIRPAIFHPKPGSLIQQLIINSKDRINYNSTSSTDFSVELPNPINAKILAYGLESCCIPKTIYNINTSSNNFTLTDSVGEKTLTLAVGNYSITKLTQDLQTALNNLGVDTYTVTFDQFTSKLSITSSYVNFILNPNEINYQLLYMLGFNPTQTYVSVAGVLNSPNIVDIYGVKNLYIKIEPFTEYMKDTVGVSSNFKIDYGGCFGSIVYFGNESKYHQYYNYPQRHMFFQKSFNIKLVDENNEVVDLNGSNWSLVLRLIVEDLY